MSLRSLKLLYVVGLSLGVKGHSENILIDCAPSRGPPSEECLTSLESIAVFKPGKTIFAKLNCFDCPTIERLGMGLHRITHEPNDLVGTNFLGYLVTFFTVAMCGHPSLSLILLSNVLIQFYNISISSSKTELYLNNVLIFPTPPVLPSKLYATQVPLNFSQASLAATYECIDFPCIGLGDECTCIPDALGTYALSFHYTAFILPQTKSTDGTEIWGVMFDAIGGHNEYVSDPYVHFNSLDQMVLYITVEMDSDETLGILGASLVQRQGQFAPGFGSGEIRFLEKVWMFFGFEADDTFGPGHVIYLQNQWDIYGRRGTLKHLLTKLQGDWHLDLISIVFGSIIGFSGLLYGIYWLGRILHPWHPLARVRDKLAGRESEIGQREHLLNEQEIGIEL